MIPVFRSGQTGIEYMRLEHLHSRGSVWFPLDSCVDQQYQRQGPQHKGVVLQCGFLMELARTGNGSVLHAMHSSAVITYLLPLLSNQWSGGSSKEIFSRPPDCTHVLQLSFLEHLIVVHFIVVSLTSVCGTLRNDPS